MASSTFWSEASSDPKRKYRFIMYMGDIPLWTVKTSGKPIATVSTSEHQYLNHTFKYPGRVTWDPINVTLVDPVNPDVAKIVFDKLKKAGYSAPLSPNVTDTMSKGKATSAIGTIRIAQIDDNGKTKEEWQLINPWFSKMEFGDLDYSSDDLNEISVEITYDYAVMSPISS